ncbi:MAG: hypothetical protein M1833_002028 [Piccolia ochrophora]|nr:MAG: hypothetical protein M1833_002028 [Piccolia ochrophora]
MDETFARHPELKQEFIVRGGGVARMMLSYARMLSTNKPLSELNGDQQEAAVLKEAFYRLFDRPVHVVRSDSPSRVELKWHEVVQQLGEGGWKQLRMDFDHETGEHFRPAIVRNCEIRLSVAEFFIISKGIPQTLMDVPFWDLEELENVALLKAVDEVVNEYIKYAYACSKGNAAIHLFTYSAKLFRIIIVQLAHRLEGCRRRAEAKKGHVILADAPYRSRPFKEFLTMAELANVDYLFPEAEQFFMETRLGRAAIAELDKMLAAIGRRQAIQAARIQACGRLRST